MCLYISSPALSLLFVVGGVGSVGKGGVGWMTSVLKATMPKTLALSPFFPLYEH